MTGILREKVYRIQDDQICGRQLVAARKILAGELIIDEPALITGPGFPGGSYHFSSASTTQKADAFNVCLVCCKNVSPSESFTCPLCSLLLCSESCCNHKQHSENECLVFPSILEVWNDKKARSKKSFYNLILVIRAVFYKLRDSKKWDQILLLESKKEALEKVGAFSELEDVFSRLTWDMFFSVGDSLQLPPEKRENALQDSEIVEIAKHCLGVMRINAFSTFSETYSREGLFFLSSFMSHCCIVNTDRQMEIFRQGRVSDGISTTADGYFLGGSRMVVRASVDIEKDEPITTTYLSLLYNTEERTRIMISNWLFTCHCNRCRDPSECQTFSAGVVCRCSKNTSISDISHVNDQLSKVCTCMSRSEILGSIQRVLRTRPKELYDIRKIEAWLDSNDNGTLLHSHHSVFAHIKLFLCQYYGRLNEGVKALSVDQLKRKVLYCHQILQIYTIVMPGIQICRGVLLFELWCALEQLSEQKLLPLELAYSNTSSSPVMISFTENDTENVKEQAKEILKYALPNSPEEAMENILLSDKNGKDNVVKA